jgi:hypothetical protein
MAEKVTKSATPDISVMEYPRPLPIMRVRRRLARPNGGSTSTRSLRTQEAHKLLNSLVRASSVLQRG